MATDIYTKSEADTEIALKISSSALDTDVTLAANSDAKIATQKATKAYVAAQIAAGGSIHLWNADKPQTVPHALDYTGEATLPGGYTFLNNAGAAAYDVDTTRARKIYLAATAASNAPHGLVAALAAGAASYQVHFENVLLNAGFPTGGGIVLADGNTDNAGKQLLIYVVALSNYFQIYGQTFTNWSANAATPMSNIIVQAEQECCLCIRRSGTTWTVELSRDGQNPQTITTITEATMAFTPVYVGPAILCNSFTVVRALAIHSMFYAANSTQKFGGYT